MHIMLLNNKTLIETYSKAQSILSCENLCLYFRTLRIKAVHVFEIFEASICGTCFRQSLQSEGAFQLQPGLWLEVSKKARTTDLDIICLETLT